jgi:polar amino acid transport system substrate-binding protein
MKTNLLVVLASIGVLLAACTVKSTSTQTPITPGTGNNPAKIRIGVDASFPPFETTGTGQNKLTGFDIELMKAIATRAGLDIEFTNVGMNQLLTGVLRCSLDGGISAITISDQLKKQMAFSNPYLTVAQVIVVKKGNISINSRDQLSGMIVGVQAGSPSVKELNKIPGAQVNSYPTLYLAFQELITGNIDAVITNKQRALIYTVIPANNLKIIDEEFGSESYGVAVCNKNPDLLKKINEGLAAVKADGTLDKLTKKWIK